MLEILEEIDGMIEHYKENPSLEAFNVCFGMEQAKHIIHKHMNDGWISVEERLPEDGTYLCTLLGKLAGQDEPFTGMCGIEKGVWDEEGSVIAWQPLPEPYRPERSKDGQAD